MARIIFWQLKMPQHLLGFLLTFRNTNTIIFHQTKDRNDKTDSNKIKATRIRVVCKGSRRLEESKNRSPMPEQIKHFPLTRSQRPLEPRYEPPPTGTAPAHITIWQPSYRTSAVQGNKQQKIRQQRGQTRTKTPSSCPLTPDTHTGQVNEVILIMVSRCRLAGFISIQEACDKVTNPCTAVR